MDNFVEMKSYLSEKEIVEMAKKIDPSLAGDGDDKNVIPLPTKFTRNEKILRVASMEMGIQEWKDGSNPRVELYLDHGASFENFDSGLTDDVPWCAGFIAWVLETEVDCNNYGLGIYPVMESTNSLMARSYEKWGRSSMSDPVAGDIVTFWRKSPGSGLGHVAFFLKRFGRDVWCLGGNQGDEVSIQRYSADRITGIRRSSKDFFFDAQTKKHLNQLGEKILQGTSISPSLKVT